MNDTLAKKKQQQNKTNNEKKELKLSTILNVLLYNAACTLQWFDLSQELVSRKFWQLHESYSKILI